MRGTLRVPQYPPPFLAPLCSVFTLDLFVSAISSGHSKLQFIDKTYRRLKITTLALGFSEGDEPQALQEEQVAIYSLKPAMDDAR